MLINGNYIVCIGIGKDRYCFQHFAINTKINGGIHRNERNMKETNPV